MSKKITKLIIVTASLWLFFKLFEPLIYPMSTFWSSEGTRSNYIGALIEEKLHIPYQSYRQAGKPSQYKQGWEDLEPISYDGWFSMKCQHPKSKSGDYFISVLAKEYLNREQREQIDCVTPTWGQMTNHCTSIFNCPSIGIAFYDYILEQPKVLDNVIKIMEKPCDYLADDFGIPTESNYKHNKE